MKLQKKIKEEPRPKGGVSSQRGKFIQMSPFIPTQEARYLRRLPDKLPNSRGVYLMKDHKNQVVYVGKATSLKKRVSSYFQNIQKQSPRLQLLANKIKNIEYITTNSDVEALILEYSLIKKYRPTFNIRFKDDKRYPYIEITTSERFPALKVTRNLVNPKNYFFGPYTSSKRLKKLINLIKKIFKIRTCKLKISPVKIQRACLDYQLNLCSAPCSHKINLKEYLRDIQGAVCFLGGYTKKLITFLKKQMKKEAEKLNYEKCAFLKKNLDLINYFCLNQTTYFKQSVSADYIGLASSERFIPLKSPVIHGEDNIKNGVSSMGGSASGEKTPSFLTGFTCLVVFQIREGKLAEEKNFLIENVIEEDFSKQIVFFFQNYYSERVFIPPQIYLPRTTESYGCKPLPIKLPQKRILEQFLGRLGNHKIKIIAPLKGKNAKLIKVACQKADKYLNKYLSHFSFEERMRILKDLQKILRLKALPLKIEAIDISNIQGKYSAGSVISFKEGEPQKNNYRHYKIKFEDTPNDLAMISEVLQRRLSKRENLPDLLLVDGGRAQLNTALKILKKNNLTNLNVIALAKKEELIFARFKKEALNLKTSPKALYLLMHLRDEAHRIAIKLHKNIRSKSLKASELDKITGVGKKYKKILLNNFDSIDKIKRARLTDLSKIQGLPYKVASNIYHYFKKGESLK